MERINQKQQILNLHKDDRWVCSTELEFMRDHRKRYSELSKAGYVFEARKCDIKGHVHTSPLFMRRLVATPNDYRHEEPLISQKGEKSDMSDTLKWFEEEKKSRLKVKSMGATLW